MAARKTTDLGALIVSVNRRIAASESVEARAALCWLLTDTLMDAGRYRGFRYIGGWQGVEEYRHYYY